MQITESEGIDVKKYFICLECKLLVLNPHEKECCGSLICEECVSIHKLKTSRCEKCEKRLFFRSNKFAGRILRNMNLACLFDCGVSDKYENLRKHMINCEERIFHCTECEFSANRKRFKAHFVENHEDVFFGMFDYNLKNNKALYSSKKKKTAFATKRRDSVEPEIKIKDDYTPDEEINPIELRIRNSLMTPKSNKKKNIKEFIDSIKLRKMKTRVDRWNHEHDNSDLIDDHMNNLNVEYFDSDYGDLFTIKNTENTVGVLPDTKPNNFPFNNSFMNRYNKNFRYFEENLMNGSYDSIDYS